MVTMPIEIYTDGSCAKNPGPGGYGYIIKYWESNSDSDMPKLNTIEVNQGYRLTTNNRMEISAALKSMEDVVKRLVDGSFMICQINLFSDSEYLCNAINQRWINKWQNNNWMTSGFQGRNPKPVKNKDLWEQVINVMNDLKNRNVNITISHVKGHNGDEFNEKADKLATSATADTTHYLIDEGYENSYLQNRR